MKCHISTIERKNLPSEEFGIPERREFPLTDAAHIRAAESYFRYAPEEFKAQLAYKILRRAELFGVEVNSPTILQWAERYAPNKKQPLKK